MENLILKVSGQMDQLIKKVVSVQVKFEVPDWWVSTKLEQWFHRKAFIVFTAGCYHIV